MDTTGGTCVTAPELAEHLGVSLARVHRLLDRHSVARGMGTGRARAVPVHVADQLVREVGAVSARVDGFDRIELLVLAVVSRAALGLESTRAVARSAGLSPSAAGRSLASLAERGLVHRQERRVVQGRPRTMNMWLADFRCPGWTDELFGAVNQVELPARDAAGPRSDRLPQRFHHLFWNANPSGLSLRRDRLFIASRLMAADDPDAWAWAADTFARDILTEASKMRGMSARRKALIQNLVAVGKEG